MEASVVDADLPTGYIISFSQNVGISEPALRLLLTLFAAYPLAFAHRTFIYGKPAKIQHWFFITTGLSFGFFNYGWQCLHSVFTIIFSFLTLVIFRGTARCVLITFFFNIAYLLIGYYYASTDHYDINWTMPQCVLVLRLIALSFDLYDGNQPEDTLGEQNKLVALRTRPTLAEYCAHMLFPASYLIGPHFNMRRYQSFVAGEFSEGDGGPDKARPPASLVAGGKRMLLGVGYMALHQVIIWRVPDDYLLSPEFAAAPFWKRALLLGVWGRASLYKYIACWLLAEGACIMLGVAYNGKDAQGNTRWDGVANVDIARFETCTEFNHYIQSFNTNTNHWVAQYAYKRLKFLGNRYLSQLFSLAFLAVWHGFHSGYYVSFFFEFIVMYMEKDIHAIFDKYPHLRKHFESSRVQTARYVLLRVYTLVFMGWCFAPFALLSVDRYWPVFRAMDYIGIWFFVPWFFLYGPLIRLYANATKPKLSDDEREHAD